MNRLLATLAAALSALAAAAPSFAQTGAVAVLTKADGSPAGSVVMTAERGKVRVRANLVGLPPGWHGFHVHTTGACAPPSFASAGGHFNPAGVVHPHHGGDMPLLDVGSDGTAFAIFTTDRFQIPQLFDADGAAVVVHANPDNHANIPPDRYDPDPDETTLATGDAGARLACGVLAPRAPSRIARLTAPTARADLRAADGSSLGFVLLRREAGKVRVRAELRRLPPGIHGFHIYGDGRCDPPSFASAGTHLESLTRFGHPNDAGDMPVVDVASDGTASLEFRTDRFDLSELFHAHRTAIIVHAQPDNYANIPKDRYDPDPDRITVTTGDAGSRIGCGVVRRVTRCRLAWSPDRTHVGRRVRVRLRLFDPGAVEPLRRTRARLRGAGVARTVTTNARGRALVTVRPSRPGFIGISVRRTLATRGCTGDISVLRARRAPVAPGARLTGGVNRS